MEFLCCGGGEPDGQVVRPQGEMVAQIINTYRIGAKIMHCNTIFKFIFL